MLTVIGRTDPPDASDDSGEDEADSDEGEVHLCSSIHSGSALMRTCPLTLSDTEYDGAETEEFSDGDDGDIDLGTSALTAVRLTFVFPI